MTSGQTSNTGWARAPAGERWGKYRPLFRLAAGGMAEVYVARVDGEAGFRRLVAVKRMLAHLGEDERFVDMFLDEARIAALITSPNVVTTTDLGRADDGSLYLVMDLVEGVALHRLLRGARERDERMPANVLVRILADAARGLHAAHETRAPSGKPLDIVHRDVSPQNIIVDVHGVSRIADFGIARALERHVRTQTGEMKGKLSYFAPEQASGEILDRRTDVFGLGVVAYEALTGRALFRAENALMTLHNVMNADIGRVDALRPELPAALADAVAAALERDPSERPRTALEWARRLEASVEPAPPEEVADAVERYGGTFITELRARLEGWHLDDDSDEVPTVAGALLVTPTGADAPEAGAPELPVPTPVAPEASPTRWWIGAAVIVVASSLAFGAVLTFGSGEEESANGVSVSGEPALIEAGESAGPEPDAVEPGDVEPSEEVAAAPPDEPGSGEEVDAEPEEPAAAARAPARPRSSTRAGSAVSERAATAEAPSEPPRAETEPAPPETRRETTPEPPTRRSGILMDRDAFERELAGE